MIILNKAQIYLGNFTPEQANLINTNRMASELYQLGFLFDYNLLDTIATHPANVDIVDNILTYYGVGELMPPLYPHWQARNYHSFGDLTVQFAAYIFQFNAEELYDHDFASRLYANSKPTDFTYVEIATVEDVYSVGKELAQSTVPLTSQNQNLLVSIIRVLDLFEVNFTIKENKVIVAANMDQPLYEVFKKLNFRPMDVMRYFAYTTNPEYVAFPPDTKFRSPTRYERNAALSWINQFHFEDICEELSHNKRLWLRFSKKFHPHDYTQFEQVFMAFHVAVHNTPTYKLEVSWNLWVNYLLKYKLVDAVGQDDKMVYRSFESRLQSAMDSGQIEIALSMLLEKSGLFGRKIVQLLNSTEDNKITSRILSEFYHIINKINVKTLLILAKTPLNRAVPRVYKVKGKLAFGETLNTNLSGLDEMVNICVDEIIYRLRKYNSVTVTQKALNLVLPLNRHGTNDSGIGRLSQFEIDGQYLQVFVNWATHNLDLDLSVGCFDDTFAMVDYCDYTHQVTSGIKHSGDYTWGPSSEYVQIDLEQLNSNVKFLVVSVLSFRNDTFNNAECVAGFLFNHVEEINLGNIETKMTLQGDYRSNLMFLVDIDANRVVWLDYGLSGSDGMQTIRSNSNMVSKVLAATVIEDALLMYEFAHFLGINVDVEDIYDDTDLVICMDGERIDHSNVVPYSKVLDLL